MLLKEEDYEVKHILGEDRKVIKQDIIQAARDELHKKEIVEADEDTIKIWKAHLKWSMSIPALHWLKEVMLQKGLDIYGQPITGSYKIAINEFDGVVSYI